MAPEQRSTGSATPQSDLYALGLVLTEMLTGRPPHPPKANRHRPTAMPEGLDPKVEGILLRCLSANPGRRPATALEILAVLTGQDPLPSPPPTASSSRPR